MRTSQTKNIKGFTLVEVMVALIIASVSLIALSTSLGQYVFNQSGIKDRVVATWVAQNRLLEIQNATTTRLEKKTTEKMLGVYWETEFVTQPTLIPGLQKVKLSAKLKGAKHLSAEVSSIIGG